MTLKDKIKNEALRAIENYRQEPVWLNKAIDFRHEVFLADDKIVFDLCNKLEISTRTENIRTINTLLANLIQNGKKRPTLIQLHLNAWTGWKYYRAGPNIINIIKTLFDNEFLDMRIGYKNEHESRMTRIWATDKLLQYCERIPNNIGWLPVELVILLDGNGKLKQYRDTGRTRQIRTILERVNKVNNEAEIWYKKDRISPYLHAIFIRKFTLYGRLHTKGSRHYQGMPEKDRAEITINGESVIELDYGALHPHLLYAGEGIQYQGDPYSVVDERPELRPFLKRILLSLLNAQNINRAEAGANRIFYNPQDADDRELAQRLYALGIDKARPFITRFLYVHEPIKHHFGNGKETGLRLMNQDARIALDVVNQFAKKGIPILCVHDSFIVQESQKQYLHDTMHNTYKRITGGFQCPIK